MLGIFGKAAREAENINKTLEDSASEIEDKALRKAIEKKEENWIWVEGWKATNARMQGYSNYQFEFNKVYRTESYNPSEICKDSGFHFCLRPDYIHNYYNYGRLFKIRALIRESDYIIWEKWAKENPKVTSSFGYYMRSSHDYSKCIAKAIEFIEEVPISEARKYFYSVDYVETDEDYLNFINYIAEPNQSVDSWYFQKYLSELKSIGFSTLLGTIFWDDFRYKHRAKVLLDYIKALYKIENMSIDMRIYLITKKAQDLVESEKR